MHTQVTPAHDPNDFACGQRHGLPTITVMRDDGTMSSAAGKEYVGLDRFEAREKVSLVPARCKRTSHRVMRNLQGNTYHTASNEAIVLKSVTWRDVLWLWYGRAQFSIVLHTWQPILFQFSPF